MNIWIFNHHALTPDMSGGTRHFDFAKALIKRGHRVTIVASSFHYSKYQELKTYHGTNYIYEQKDGVNFVWIKTRSYYGNGIGRVINMLDYMYKALHVEIEKKPDIIIGSSVHLFAVYAAYKIAKKLNVPFVMEVRDIWPQTLIDLGISKWHPFILLLGVLERFLYQKADKIISLLPFAYEHIEKFGIKRDNIVWISNGVDLQKFKSLQRETQTRNFTITYTGSMGEANVMHTILEVAKILKKDYPKIQFKLIGEGNLKSQFIQYQKQYSLTNVMISDAIPKDQIAQVLKNSDLLYVGLKDSPLYRFGISLNKIFDYLAAEVPIVFAGNVRNNLVEESHSGITIPPENTEALKDAILKIYEMSDEQKVFYTQGNLNYIENNFSIQFLTNKLENLLNGLLCNKKN